MPPQKSSIACPRCKQPIPAIIERLFDVSADPAAKQRLLGGISNVAHCQTCGYSGSLATPIIYHDADKELLLTFFPPELGLPANEQEKYFGPLITQATSQLPAEKRKGYLLRPQSFFTFQSLVERILAADGITPEMIKTQQHKISIIEKLISGQNAEIRSGIIKEEASYFDNEFFAIFSRLHENISSSGQEQLIQQMDAVQQQLMLETEFGKQITNQTNEIREAVKTLQTAGTDLDREKLIDIFIEAPTPERVSALVNLIRPALDYQFFQSFSTRIDAQSEQEQQRLIALRQTLLELTQRYDQRIEKEYNQAGEVLEKFLQSNDIKGTVLEHLDEVNEVFTGILQDALQDAEQKKDSERLEKLKVIISVIQNASTPPIELQFLEKLLEAPDEASISTLLEENENMITPEFISFVGNILARTEEQSGGASAGEEAELMDNIEKVNRAILHYSMKKNISVSVPPK